jgi:hypothetical protein
MRVVRLAFLAILLICSLVSASCGDGPDDGDVTVTETENGITVQMQPGFRLFVLLDTTFWTVEQSSDPAVLEQTGATVHNRNDNCPPSGAGGCGSTTATFHAIGLTGQADVTASRTMCEEGVDCSGPQANFRVTVVITRALAPSM